MLEKIRVLYLDDEEQNLTSFRASFRRDFEIYTTTSPSEAVQILNETDIQVIISDQKMPDLSGVEFFELILPDFPNPVRMLLTGYADIEAVIDAINKGQVFRYIAKPWNDQELRMTIHNAYEVYVNRLKIKEQRDELAKAYGELEKFTYSASHDMRAPLVSILGIVKMARAEGDSAPCLKYLDMIEQSVEKLDVFVQNLIQYYQNIKSVNTLEEVDFNEILKEVFDSLRFVDANGKLEMLKSVDGQGVFEADPLRIRILLNNLVSNAIKFCDPKKDSKYLRVVVSYDRDKALIRIEDNGLGIEDVHLTHIFDMFYKANQSEEGSGIGLYIVKEAIEKLGGTISVQSQVNKGTVFNIELPNHA